MLRKTKIQRLCDNLCRAEKLRQEALLTLALQGPRV